MTKRRAWVAATVAGLVALALPIGWVWADNVCIEVTPQPQPPSTTVIVPPPATSVVPTAVSYLVAIGGYATLSEAAAAAVKALDSVRARARRRLRQPPRRRSSTRVSLSQRVGTLSAIGHLGGI